MKTTAINTDDMKEKLEDISISDDPGDLIQDFCKFLSKRLKDELEPLGFAIGCHLALSDIKTGIDGYKQKPIPSKLVGHSSAIYTVLQMRFPDIAVAVCPKDFADEVVKIFKEM